MKFSKIKNINHLDFEKAMRIYETSFPLNERQSKDTIKKRIKKNKYIMYIGCIKNKVVFMALIYPLKNTDFILLDYMATEENFRNQGIGTCFIKDIIKKIEPNYLILEVENPKYGKNKEKRKKRVRFYKNLGAKEMKNTTYYIPPLSGKKPTNMKLMIMPNYNQGKIENCLVKKLIVQIYKELYNRDGKDKILNSFINNIKNPVELI